MSCLRKCEFCSNYTKPKHPGDICCAVNPGGNAVLCKDFVAAIPEGTIERGMEMVRSKNRSEWQSQIAIEAEKLGLKVTVSSAESQEKRQPIELIDEEVFMASLVTLSGLGIAPEPLAAALIELLREHLYFWCDFYTRQAVGNNSDIKNRLVELARQYQ